MCVSYIGSIFSLASCFIKDFFNVLCLHKLLTYAVSMSPSWPSLCAAWRQADRPHTRDTAVVCV